VGLGQQSSLTGQRLIRAGSKLGRLGWIRARLWLATWQAVALPYCSHGPPLGCGLWLAVHGGPGDAGPWTADRTTVVRVHPSSHRRGSCAPSSFAGGQREGESSPVSPVVVLLPVVSSLVSLRGGASVQLTWVEALMCLGVFIGGVNTACRVLWCVGHGGSLLGTTAAPVRWLRPR
jgi:hypothetical protein